jgi:vanillate O-demethylase monooxygenase subunit
MGSEGKVIAMPGQNVAGFAANRKFPCKAYAGFVWVWLGEPELAQAADLPKLPWAEDAADHANWAYGGGYYAIACDYRLMIDNLMDLSHETYVHAGSIGQKEIENAPCITRSEGDHAITSRHMFDIEAPPFWKMALEQSGLPTDQPVDRWQVCHFTPPSHVHIEVGVALAGRGGIDAPNDVKTYGVVVDFITPETDTTMHYHWGMARRFKPESAELTQRIQAGQGKIFSEDREMLERQQRNLQHYATKRVMGLNIDAGGIAARRIIDRRIKAEAVPRA